jgi:hypothetical protein
VDGKDLHGSFCSCSGDRAPEIIIVKAGRQFPKKDWAEEGVASLKRDLFPEDAFEPVTGKSTQDEDDEKDKYLDEEAGSAEIPDTETHPSGNKVPRGEHENYPQDKADNHTVLQEAVIVFLSLVEKAKGDT